jgi:hypothetical protein
LLGDALDKRQCGDQRLSQRLRHGWFIHGAAPGEATPLALVPLVSASRLARDLGVFAGQGSGFPGADGITQLRRDFELRLHFHEADDALLYFAD